MMKNVAKKIVIAGVVVVIASILYKSYKHICESNKRTKVNFDKKEESKGEVEERLYTE